MPFQSQMTVAIKSHGFTTGTFARKALNAPESTRKLNNHLKELNSTAILLIRNPFKAIIGHRHLDEGGHTGHAPAKSFLGPGWCFFYVEAFTHREKRLRERIRIFSIEYLLSQLSS